jgi:hypothetical protein
MACGPRNIINENDENSEIDIDTFHKLKELLMCPICTGIMKEPLNVKTCLHKFCAPCIENYNRTMYKYNINNILVRRSVHHVELI